MSLVLDSSAALAWIYDDEATEPIRRVFTEVAEQGAFVPSLWRLEIANSLTVAVRRGRIESHRGLTIASQQFRLKTGEESFLRSLCSCKTTKSSVPSLY